jgi:hypothetical protein
MHALTNAVIEHAQKHFQAQSKAVVVIRPTHEGHDFNDILKNKGKKEVQAYVNESALRLAKLRYSPELQKKSDHILRLSAEITEKLQHLRATPLDADLKSNLLAQAKALRHDPDLLDSLRILNPEVAKEMEKLIQEQQRNKGIER